MIYLIRDNNSDRIVAVKSERIDAIRLIDRLVEWCGSESWNRFYEFTMPLDENDLGIVARVAGVEYDEIDFMSAPNRESKK